MSEKILDAIDQLGRKYEQFKEANDANLKAIEARNGEVVTETKERLEKVEADLMQAIEIKQTAEKQHTEVMDRLETLESKGIRPGSAADNEQEQAGIAHKAAFVEWLRDGTKLNKLREAEKNAIEHKAVTIASSTGGGNAMPEDLQRRIETKLTEISPFRPSVAAGGAGCRLVTASTNDVKLLVDSKGTTSGWAAEATSRAETATPVINEVAPTMGELYAVPKASEWSLDDIFFNVEDWLVNSVATAFAAAEGAAFASGDGTNKPTGFLTGTPVTTADDASPARAFGVVQYTASGAAGAFVNDRVGSPPGDPGDKLIDLMCTLRAGHRQQAVWLMSKATMCVVMKFHDADGNYLWRPGLQAGVPNTILAYPVVEAEDMPVIAANSFSIAFGDFDSGYAIVDRVGMRVTRDEVTSKGHILWYVRKRLGGKILNDDAIKLMKMAAS